MNELNFDKKSDKHISIQQKKMELEAGLLGKIFGNAKTAPSNICGMVMFMLLITSTAVCFCPANIEPQDYLKMAFPVVTGILGYLFGSKSSGTQ